MDIWDIEDNTENISNYKKMEEIILSNLQKQLILERWKDESKQPPSIAELLKISYPNENFDGRSKQATLIKELLVTNGLCEENKFIGSKRGFELLPEHKEYIKNNYSIEKPMEMARQLFGMNINVGSSEVKEVNAYVRVLDKKPMYGEDIESNYKPPRSLDKAVTRIKKYIDETKSWDSNKLTPSQKKQIEALLGYLATYRFKHQIDSYEAQADKELFESSFIKYCYDKDDLTQENVDQYILLCSEIVIGSQIENDINMLNREQNRTIEEDGKVSMAIVETIKNARKERDECIKRQSSLYKSLTQERSEKLNEEIKDKATLLNLFQTWKQYDTRQQILKLRQKDKINLRKELHEIDNMDELKCRVLGLSIEEVLNG